MRRFTAILPASLMACAAVGDDDTGASGPDPTAASTATADATAEPTTAVAFLAHLRAVYPDAFILAVAPTLFGDAATMVAGYLQSAVGQRHMAGDVEVAFADVNVDRIGSGCDGHPTVATHAGMGARLTEELQAHLGW